MKRATFVFFVAVVSFAFGRWSALDRTTGPDVTQAYSTSEPNDGRIRVSLLPKNFDPAFLHWSDPTHEEVTIRPIQTDELYGPCRVSKIVDGDTVDVACGQHQDRVRLLNIDTPEYTGGTGWGAMASTQAIVPMIEETDIYLAFEEPGSPTRGRYGRLLAFIIANGRNVNIEMVRGGWSQYYRKYGAGRLADQFIAAENQAHSDGRGLWCNGHWWPGGPCEQR